MESFIKTGKSAIISSGDKDSLEYEYYLFEKPKLNVIILYDIFENSILYNQFVDYMRYTQMNIFIPQLELKKYYSLSKSETYKFERIVKDIDALVDYLNGNYNGIPIIIIGNGVGAFLSLYYLIQHQNKIFSTILSSPLVKFNKQIYDLSFMDKFKLLFNKNANIKINYDISLLSDNDNENFKVNNNNIINQTIPFSLLFDLQSISERIIKNVNKYSLPCLILLPGYSPLIDIEYVKTFFSQIRCKDKKLLVFGDLKHQLLLEKKETSSEVYMSMFSWINNIYVEKIEKLRYR